MLMVLFPIGILFILGQKFYHQEQAMLEVRFEEFSALQLKKVDKM